MGILNNTDDFISYADIKNSNVIFKTVTRLIEKFNQSSVVPVIFNNTINEVNPLFFIVLLAESDKKNKKISIDIREASPYVQSSVQHFLRQQLDLGKIDLFIKNADNENDPYYIVKSCIVATEDATKSAISFNSYKIGGYQYLPIMSLRDLPDLADEWDTGSLFDQPKGEKKRKAYYRRVSLHEGNLSNLLDYQNSLQNTVFDFFQYLKLNKLEHAEPLSTILFELIDNIRKHTPDNVSGYFSFSRIQRKDDEGNDYYEYQLIVADNGENGVLNNYCKELICEKFSLRTIVENKSLLDGYKKTINLLKSTKDNDNKVVLRELYNLESIKTTHQVPRVAMHFGIPMLIKMLPFFKDKDSIHNLLEVYTHRDEQYYKIAYDSNANFRGVSKEEHAIKGTYIILTFTDRIGSYRSPTDENNFVGNVKNQDYQEILKDYEDYQIEINKFQYIQNILSLPKETKNFILDATYIKHETFSEFLRKVYFQASKGNLSDIVIVNIDLKKIYSHLQLMAHIIYDNMDKPYKRTINLLFYDKYSPGVIFLGGKTREEFLFVAEKLKNHYQIDTSLGLQVDNQSSDASISIESSLFYKNFLLPFELFPIKDHDLNDILLLETMLNNFLNKNAKDDIHIDTQVGVHIDKFMDFRTVFEDSRWVKRLAFVLAKQLDNNVNSKIIMIGTDRYTNMLLSLSEMYIDSYKKNKIEKYNIFNIYEKSDYIEIKKEIEKGKLQKIVLISSVRYKGEKVHNLREELSKEVDFQEISIIQLQLEKSKKIVSNNRIAEVVNNGEIYLIKDNKYCDFCEKKRKNPLVELDKNDPFLLKDTYYENREIESMVFTLPSQVNWNKSFYFGHIERGNNHFLYYIDTIEFFKNNYASIENFLTQMKRKLKSNNKKVLLLAPSHNTHNNFTSLVNRIIFENEATVLYFDRNKGEDNFHKLSSYIFDWKNTEVFFVDDSIASGYTLEYFYALLKSMPSYLSNIDEIGFDGAFVMIDRISIVDENIIENYLKNNNLYAFTAYNVKPIKTEAEECFLCKREAEYLDLMTKSVLDLSIFKMADKALKIKEINYKYIELNNDLEDRLKSYIKALATDFISKSMDNENIGQLLSDFREYLWLVFVSHNKSFIDKYGEDFIKEVLEFEVEIALIKAMSFPKISYYYTIRKMVIEYITDKIKSNYIGKEQLITNKIIVNSPKQEGQINEQSTKYKFIHKYETKTNLHRLNAYFSILGYFRDPILLRKEYIKLYYLATQKKDEFDDKKVLHTYPFAVKMTISDNKEKSNFFEKNLVKFYKEQKRGDYEFGQMEWALVDALYLENTLFDRNQFIDTIDENSNQQPRVKDFFDSIKAYERTEQRFNKLKDKLNSFIDVSDVKLFIFPETNNKFDSYKEYLTKAKENLVDVFNNFENLDVFKNSEAAQKTKELFCGMHDDNGTIKHFDLSSIDEKIDDTWANYYQDGYTIVRLVKVDKSKLFSTEVDRKNYKENNNLWFKPIGCMVLKHDSEKDHLRIVRKVLAIRYELVEFIIDELGHGGIQEAIQNKEYESLFGTFSHEIAPLFELNRILEKVDINDQGIKQKIKHYTTYAENLTKIGRIKRYKDIEVIPNPLKLKDFLDREDGYGKMIDDFFELYEKYIKNYENPIFTIEGIENLKDFVIPLDDVYLQILFCELLFNAYKYSPADNKTITLKVEKDVLSISNPTDNSSTHKGNQIALSNLNYMLNKIGWNLTKSIIIGDNFSVNIVDSNNSRKE